MQHERAAVMALTFCIGFTTAFIAYGLPTMVAPIAVVPATQPASVMMAEKSTMVHTGEDVPPAVTNVGVRLDADGLWLQTGFETQLISPSLAAAPDLPEAHVDIHQAVVRADGAYVFFCAETLEQTGVCEPRVFDVADFTVYRVESQGQTGSLSVQDLSVTWLTNGLLAINGFQSSSLATPWVVE
jgi:hypothetical protein